MRTRGGFLKGGHVMQPPALPKGNFLKIKDTVSLPYQNFESHFFLKKSKGPVIYYHIEGGLIKNLKCLKQTTTGAPPPAELWKIEFQPPIRRPPSHGKLKVYPQYFAIFTPRPPLQYTKICYYMYIMYIIILTWNFTKKPGKNLELTLNFMSENQWEP